MMNVKEAYGCVRGGNICTAPNIWDRVACGCKCELPVTWYGYSAVRRSPLYALRMWSSYRPRDCCCATPVGPWLSVNGWSWALVGAFLMRGRVCFENAKSVASAARGSSTSQSCCSTPQFSQHQPAAHQKTEHTSGANCSCPMPCVVFQELEWQHENWGYCRRKRLAGICWHATDPKAIKVIMTEAEQEYTFRRSIKFSTWVHSSSESLRASIFAHLLKSVSSRPIS